MEELVASEWLSYQAAALPKDAPNVQIVETRRAFYAGAKALLGLLTRVVGPGAEPTQAELAMVEQINTELDDFSRRVANGRA